MVPCLDCYKTFSTTSSLNRHKRNVHGNNQLLRTSSRLICPNGNCAQQFSRYDGLRDHLNTAHGIFISAEEFLFDSEEEFDQWCHTMQSETSSEYVKGTSTKIQANGCRKTYLFCNRSMKYRKNAAGLRAIKSMGSKKIGKVCPSTIELSKRVFDNRTEIKVKFWKDHFGHTCDLGHTSIPTSDRKNIARKLKSGISMDGVLDEIRKDGESAWSKRTSIIERKDLHNIVQQYNITYSTKRHKEDGLSVKMWVNEMEKTEQNPILFYKEQGQSSEHFQDNDFALGIMTAFQKEQILKFGTQKMCIDGTHGTNAYGILLHTLLTIDEFGSGVPVAYFLCNRSDETAFKYFFNQIKEQVGTINCSVFMSDDAPAMFNAWVCVMGDVKNRLLCTWHVDRCWQKNLSKIKGGGEKKKQVYKTLRTLLQCTEKEDEFKILLHETTVMMLSDDETKDFGEYFVKHYVSRPETWAYFYRKGVGINTNMHLEAFHKSLKHIYLEGKKVKRLDKTIHALMRFTRDCMFKRLIKLTKNTPSEKTLNVHKSHRKSTEVKKISSINNDEWLVESTSNSQQTYVVKRLKDVCANQCIKCAMCNICVHSFECSCMDNVIKLNICKHIHACARLTTNDVRIEDPIDQNGHNQCEVESLFSLARSQGPSVAVKEILKGKLLTAIELLEKTPEEIVMQTRNDAEKNIDNILKLYNEVPIKVLEKEEINTTQKIDRQVRLFSTKKKSKPNSIFKKPSINESKSIADGLKNLSKESLNVHSEFDHTYCK